MKNLTTLILILFSFVCSFAQPSHEAWNKLLVKYVSPNGGVNYEGFKNDHTALKGYLDYLSANTPKDNWSRNDKMAYWINAYNAFTIELIVKNYPVKSINDIKEGDKKPWDISFISLGSKKYTLNQIEHEILRKEFADPRIHFAVNCASFSCPPLLNAAFTGEKLESQLNLLAKNFINDAKRNRISASSIEVSEIFNWFKDDFTKNGSLIDFLNKYSKVKISPTAKVGYMAYNWNLNKQ